MTAAVTVTPTGALKYAQLDRAAEQGAPASSIAVQSIHFMGPTLQGKQDTASNTTDLKQSSSCIGSPIPFSNELLHLARYENVLSLVKA